MPKSAICVSCGRFTVFIFLRFSVLIPRVVAIVRIPLKVNESFSFPTFALTFAVNCFVGIIFLFIVIE